MFRRIGLVVALVLSSAAFAASVSVPTASAVTNGEMFTVEWEGGLYAVDPATGTTTFIADTGVGSITGLVWEPSSSTLLAVTYDGPCVLTRIDPTSGAATVVGDTGFDDCTGLDRDPSTGTLYAVYDANSGSNLMTVDPATGTPSVIDSVELVGGGDVRIASLAFSGGTLYGFGYDGNLYSLSTANAAATLVQADVIDGPDVMGANVDCSGVLYGTDSQDLFTVDVSGSTFDFVGTMFDGDLFSENLTVACGVAPPPPTTPTTTTTPPPTTQAVVAAPRFTG